MFGGLWPPELLILQKGRKGELLLATPGEALIQIHPQGGKALGRGRPPSGAGS